MKTGLVAPDSVLLVSDSGPHVTLRYRVAYLLRSGTSWDDGGCLILADVAPGGPPLEEGFRFIVHPEDSEWQIESIDGSGRNNDPLFISFAVAGPDERTLQAHRQELYTLKEAMNGNQS